MSAPFRQVWHEPHRLPGENVNGSYNRELFDLLAIFKELDLGVHFTNRQKVPIHIASFYSCLAMIIC
jgi:hypothetical protein